MGSPIALMLADVFISYVIEEALSASQQNRLTVLLRYVDDLFLAEVGVARNSSQVSQVALRTMPFFQLLHNLRCALCLFFQRLRNLRLRIGKSNICCALIANFFQNAQLQNNF